MQFGLTEGIILGLIAALSSALVALLNRRSSVDAEATKRLDMALERQGEEIKKQATQIEQQGNTIEALRRDMEGVREQFLQEKQDHLETRIELDRKRAYIAYIQAELRWFGTWLDEKQILWPSRRLLSFQEWKDLPPYFVPPDWGEPT